MTPIFSLHFSSSWVKIRLHTEIQLSMLSESALKISAVGLKVHHPGFGPNLFLHISFSCVEIRLHIKFHPSRLPESAAQQQHRVSLVVGGPPNYCVTPNSC